MKGQGSVVLLLGGLQKEQRCLLLRIIIGDECVGFRAKLLFEL